MSRCRTIIVFLFLLISLFGCRQRHRPDFYKNDPAGQILLQNEEMYYLDSTRISSTPRLNFLSPGAGKVMVLIFSRELSQDKAVSAGLMKVTPRETYRIAVNLPDRILADSLPLAGQSLCQLSGRFDIPDSLNLYFGRDGYLRVDSVQAAKFFAGFEATFVNQANDTLAFSGWFWVKRRQ